MWGDEGNLAYHVESNDIFKGDFAGFVFLDEDFIDADWGGTGRETEDEGVFFCWVEGFDSVCNGDGDVRLWGRECGGQRR